MSRSPAEGFKTEGLEAPATEPSGSPEPPAALREDQIQNAVAFLSHAKVRDSPVATKRSFLERKGLTAAEIDEAFSRVPPAAQTAIVQEGTASTPPKPWQAQQTQVPNSSATHSAPATPAGAPQTALQTVATSPQENPLRWSQVILGATMVAAGVFAVKSYVWPYARDLWSQYRATRSKEQEELLQLRKDMQEIVQGLQTNQLEVLKTISELTAQLKEEHSRPKESPVTASDLRMELRNLATALANDGARGSYGYGYVDRSYSANSEVAELGKELHQVRAQLNKYTRQAEYQPPNYFGSTGPGDRMGAPLYPYGDSPARMQQTAGHMKPTARATPDATPYSQSFQEVMEMVSQGITPPNVRTDINDQPPDPTRPVTEPRLLPKPKPWESRQSQPSSSNSSLVDVPVTVPVQEPLTYRSPIYAGNGSRAPAQDGYFVQPESTATHAFQEKVVEQTTVTTSSWRPPPPPLPTVNKGKAPVSVDPLPSASDTAFEQSTTEEREAVQDGTATAPSAGASEA